MTAQQVAGDSTWRQSTTGDTNYCNYTLVACLFTRGLLFCL